MASGRLHTRPETTLVDSREGCAFNPDWRSRAHGEPLSSKRASDEGHTFTPQTTAQVRPSLPDRAAKFQKDLPVISIRQGVLPLSAAYERFDSCSSSHGVSTHAAGVTVQHHLSGRVGDVGLAEQNGGLQRQVASTAGREITDALTGPAASVNDRDRSNRSRGGEGIR